MLDQDGDGWTPLDGDCCDDAAACADPASVNPGALELPGNGVDDDCASFSDDGAPTPTCSVVSAGQSASAYQLAKAMDLCSWTQESVPAPSERRWGVISATLTLADGTAAPMDIQTGVMGAYGPNVLPSKGETMAALSSGTARAPTDPGYVHPQNGSSPGQTGNFNAQTQSAIPADYLATNGGVVPSACSPCVGAACTQAFDSVRLSLRIRVPTNVHAFSYRTSFYTAEYPEYLCESFQDTFLTRVTSGATGLPADGNVCMDALGKPMSANNQFMEVCFPYVGAPPGACSQGTLELIGTGMGGWNASITDGAATGWLVNEVPVVPGETIQVDFILWDAGDHNVDSLVLLDHFKWNVAPATVALHR